MRINSISSTSIQVLFSMTIMTTFSYSMSSFSHLVIVNNIRLTN